MTKETIAQWVIDNRYPKSEYEKLSDHELYHGLIEMIDNLIQGNIDEDCSHDFLVDMFDHFGFPASRVCDKCGYRESVQSSGAGFSPIAD